MLEKLRRPKVFATASGRLVDVNNFKAEDVCLDDIAHHLAKLQRFNGAPPIDVSYTVGEHCINLYQFIIQIPDIVKERNTEIAKLAMLHDASEAYLNDIVSPVKCHLEDYCYLESLIQTTIYKKYLGYSPIEKYINYFDKRVVMDEIEHINPNQLEIYKAKNNNEKLGCHIEYNNHPAAVKKVFLQICKDLGISDEKR